MAASLRRGADHGEPSLEAGVELAERGARRAVMDFWGRLHGFTQLGVPKRGWDSVGRYHASILRVTETGLEMRGVVVCRSRTSRLTGTMWGTIKRAGTSCAGAHVTSRVGWPRRPAGPAWGVCGGRGGQPNAWRAPGGKIPRALTLNPKPQNPIEPYLQALGCLPHFAVQG
jgi:hypothetical protein